jgi:two-component system, NtrC family, response regulator PilR
VRPLGGSSEISIDVRVIAATNKDLAQMVLENGFREDLYYRISVIPIRVPSLRERRDDVPLLANAFLKHFAPAAGKSIHKLAPASLTQLIEYDWPGNVRQLENAIERAVAMEATDELHVELPIEKHKKSSASGVNGDALTSGHFPMEGVDLERYIAEIEKKLIQSALKHSGGVQTRAADLLKVSYRSFRHLLKKYEI